MAYELHHSAVITGALNCFCLACDSFLNSRKDAFCHIETASHCGNLNAAPYLDKFKDQHVRQFKTGYYCEFCNKLLSTALQVNLHVAEDLHKQNRGSNLLKFVGNEIIAFKNVLIKESAWHGLMDNVCCICDTEFEDEADHKANTSHILTLIQRPVKFGVNDDIYRQVEDSTIQCLTCNKLFYINTMNEHFGNAEHRHYQEKCKSEQDKNNNQTDKTAVDDADNINKDETSIVNEEHEIFKIMSNAATYQDNDIDINYEIETAFCRNCWIDIEFNHEYIDKHIEKHLKMEISTSAAARYPVDHDRNRYCPTSQTKETLEVKYKGNDYKDDSVKNTAMNYPKILPAIEYSELAYQEATKSSAFESLTSNEKDHEHTSEAYNFAKDNDITYNSNSGKAYCRICEVKLPSSLTSMKEHVKGAHHSKRLSAYKTKMTNKAAEVITEMKENHIATQTVSIFVKSLKSLRSPFGSGYLINHQYYISPSSFLLFTEGNYDSAVKCMLCKTTVLKLPWIFDPHVQNCSLPRGKKLKVVTTVKNEFIREIEPGRYHCAHCHIVVTGWSTMELHLKSSLHSNKKGDSYLLLGVINGNLPLGALLLCSDN